jgi:hypothetical protein
MEEADSDRMLGEVGTVYVQIPTRKTDIRFETVSKQKRVESTIDAFRESIPPLLPCCFRYLRMRI